MSATAVLLAAALQSAAPATSMPENVLVIDSSRGRIVVLLNPKLAPQGVARMKALARAGVYDGLLFHRVIDGFMAQTGNPGNVDGGRSALPDLPPEFTFRRGDDTPFTPVAQPAGAVVGFVGANPVMGQSEALRLGRPTRQATSWGLYCAGVVGMGRGEAEDSANSEFFLMRAPWPMLDKRYTVVGRVIGGLDVVRAIKAGGDVVPDPDPMTRVALAADLPPAERPRLTVDSPAAFAEQVAAARARRGADFSACDLEPPIRVAR